MSPFARGDEPARSRSAWSLIAAPTARLAAPNTCPVPRAITERMVPRGSTNVPASVPFSAISLPPRATRLLRRSIWWAFHVPGPRGKTLVSRFADRWPLADGPSGRLVRPARQAGGFAADIGRQRRSPMLGTHHERTRTAHPLRTPVDDVGGDP